MNGRAAVAVAMNTHNMKNWTVAELGIALAQFAPRVINEIRFTRRDKGLAAHNNSRRAPKPDQTLRGIGVVRIDAHKNLGPLTARAPRWERPANIHAACTAPRQRQTAPWRQSLIS